MGGIATRTTWATALSLILVVGLWWPGLAQAQGVTTSDLEAAAGNNSEWLMYGRDYLGQRFVELDQITPDNVERLDPVWVFAAGGANRGLEATPLLHDGVIYLSADESRVFAIDARTGARSGAMTPRSAPTWNGSSAADPSTAAWRSSGTWCTSAPWTPG